MWDKELFDAWELNFGYAKGYPNPKIDLSFAHFPELRVLETQQVLFYCFDADSEQTIQTSDCRRFLAKLPKMVWKLHIGAVVSWSIMYRDLKGLLDALDDFPYLQILKLDSLTKPDRNKINYWHHIFSDVNVTLSVSVADEYRRGMMGPKPGYELDQG